MQKIHFRTPFLASLFFLLFFQQSWSQEFVWAYTAGGPGFQELALDAAVDDSGNVYMVGQYEAGAAFGSTFPPNMGSFDLFLAKFDIDGNLIWLETLNSSTTDKGYSLRIGPSGYIYVVGYSKVIFPAKTNRLHARDALLAKYGPDGTLMWGRPIDGDNFNETHDLEIDSAGNIYITGRFNTDSYFPGDTLWGNGNTDLFLAKYNPQGDLLWVNGYGGPRNDESWGVSVDGAANVYIGGFFQDSCLFDTTWVYGVGGKDAFVAKHDSSGNLLWVRTFAGAGDDEVLSIKSTPEGHVYFGGNFQDSLFFGTDTVTAISFFDIFFARMDSSGTVNWAEMAGGSSFDGLEDIQIGPDEDVYMCGFFFANLTFEDTITLTGAGGYDAWMARIDSSGNYKSSEISTYQATGSFLGLDMDQAENLYITGRYLDSLFLDSIVLAAPTRTTDFFLARYSPARELRLDSVPGSPSCTSDTLCAYFDVKGAYNGNNIFYLELSDANGSFAAPDTIAQLPGFYGGKITATIPPFVPNGLGYRVRVASDSPTLISLDNGSDIEIRTNLGSPLQLSGDTLLCNLPDTAYWSVAGTYASYNWSNGDTGALAAYTTAGIHYVEVSDSFGCTATDTFVISLCVANPEAQKLNLSISPIPADRKLMIDWSEPFPKGEVRLTIWDSQGKKTFFKKVKPTGRRIVVPTSHLPEGLYFVDIFSGESIFRHKVLIIHSY